MQKHLMRTFITHSKSIDVQILLGYLVRFLELEILFKRKVDSQCKSNAIHKCCWRSSAEILCIGSQNSKRWNEQTRESNVVTFLPVTHPFAPTWILRPQFSTISNRIDSTSSLSICMYLDRRKFVLAGMVLWKGWKGCPSNLRFVFLSTNIFAQTSLKCLLGELVAFSAGRPYPGGLWGAGLFWFFAGSWDEAKLNCKLRGISDPVYMVGPSNYPSSVCPLLIVLQKLGFEGYLLTSFGLCVSKIYSAWLLVIVLGFHWNDERVREKTTLACVHEEIERKCRK